MQYYNKDQHDLKQLATFHYVLGGLGMFFSLFALIYVAVGVAMIYAPESMDMSDTDAPPEFVAGIFIAIGSVLFLLGEIGSICLIVSGKKLKKQTGYMFSFVMACLCCLNMPLGTILGIFTIMVLQRDSVKTLYNRPGFEAKAPVGETYV